MYLVQFHPWLRRTHIIAFAGSWLGSWVVSCSSLVSFFLARCFCLLLGREEGRGAGAHVLCRVAFLVPFVVPSQGHVMKNGFISPYFH